MALQKNTNLFKLYISQMEKIKIKVQSDRITAKTKRGKIYSIEEIKLRHKEEDGGGWFYGKISEGWRVLAGGEFEATVLQNGKLRIL